MRKNIYLDQNVLGNLDDEVLEMILSWKQKDIFPIVSHHHLTEICQSPNFEKYIPRLKKLEPFFLSSEKSGELKNRLNTELSILDVRSEISWHHKNIKMLEQKFLQLLSPMIKIMGGLRETDNLELAESYVRSMQEAVAEQFVTVGAFYKLFFRGYFSLKIWIAKREIHASFRKANFQEDARKFTELRKRVVDLGNISTIPVELVAETIIHQMDSDDQELVLRKYPKNFAQNSSSRSESLTAFSLLLYAAGAVPKTRKNFSGSEAGQEKKFRAQFLDCLHIGEAGYFNAFVTCDSGAYRLARAVYSYSGANTESVLLPIASKNKAII